MYTLTLYRKLQLQSSQTASSPGHLNNWIIYKAPKLSLISNKFPLSLKDNQFQSRHIRKMPVYLVRIGENRIHLSINLAPN